MQLVLPRRLSEGLHCLRRVGVDLRPLNFMARVSFRLIPCSPFITSYEQQGGEDLRGGLDLHTFILESHRQDLTYHGLSSFCDGPQGRNLGEPGEKFKVVSIRSSQEDVFSKLWCFL